MWRQRIMGDYRSAAYATGRIAKNLVAAGLCEEVLVKVAYAIGVAKPMGLFVDTYGTSKIELTDGAGKMKKIKVRLFPWEALDYVSKVKKLFGIH